MTIEEKVGAMLVFGWTEAADGDATQANEHAREIVQEAKVGGVVLLGRNIADDLSVTASTLNDIQSMSREPLFMIADQEGGMVARFIENVTVFPSNMALGAAGDPDLAYHAAAATADELLAVGVNFNFAPTVDVNNNPDNPIIGTRSYGETPERVSQFAQHAILGYQDRGMIACAKHFPGHGDTAVDSHRALPTVPYPRKRLDEVELKPFAAAVDVGVSAIMTTHIMFPAVDQSLPATLSPAIVTGLLRNEMGYDGVVVTDCMEMKALANKWGTPEACVLAVEAGVDLLLVCHTRATQQASRAALLEAVRSGRISESRLDESLRRITALKQQYGLRERRWTGPAALGSVLRNPAHLDLQKQIAEVSVTLVRNDDNLVPIRPKPAERLVVMGLHHTVTPLAVAVRRHCANVEAVQLAGDSADVMQRAVEACANADILVVPTCPLEPWRAPVDQELQAKLVAAVAASGKRLAVVAVREPYDLRRFPQVKTYLCTYGYRGGSLEAAAAVLCGAIKPKGSLPVTIPLDVSPSAQTSESGAVIEEYF